MTYRPPRPNLLRPQGELTRKKMLQYIRNYWKENKHSPSYREIMARMGVNSTSVVAYHVNLLIKQGLLTMERGKPRSLRPHGLVVDVNFEREGEDE